MREAIDAIIIGAGVIGCGIAYELSRAGWRCTVLEKCAGAARGASGASLGCLNYAPGVPRPPRWHALASRAVAAHREWERELAGAFEHGTPYHWGGRLTVFENGERAALVRRRFEEDRDAGLPVDWLDRKTLRELEPRLAGRVAGAALNRDGGWVRARDLTLALQRAAQSAGAQFCFDEAAAEILLDHSRVAGVRTPLRTLNAKNAIVCAGAWSTPLDPNRRLRVRPLRGQALSFATGAPPIRHTIYGGEVYLVPRPDGFAVGATHEDAGFDAGNTAQGVGFLLDKTIELLPEVRELDWARVRPEAGLRPAVDGALPFIGADPQVAGLCWATGHMYHGVLLSALTGRLIAGALTGDAPAELFTLEAAPRSTP